MNADITEPLKVLLNNGQEFKPETNHYFSDGVCIREMIVPAGSIILGAGHKTKHLTTLVQGVMQIRIGNESRLIEAPTTFESLDGSRKVGFAYTKCVVHNIFPTDSKDIDEIENEFMTIKEDKFNWMLANHGLTREHVDAISFDDSTYEPLNIYTIKDSPIHGKGLFSDRYIYAGEYIGVASKAGIRSELGRYVNHSDNPNTRMEFNDGVMTVYAITDIEIDTEFTVDYGDNITKLKEEISCQVQ